MRRALLLTVAVAVCWQTAGAQRTIPMSLRDMVRDAGTIVHAVVSETRTGKDPVTLMPATWVRLEINENFYGAVGKTLTFKQIGGAADGMVFRVADIPSYARGEEVILMLYAPHSGTGFTSPVGMGQGKFVVRTPAAPRKKIVEQIAPTNALLKEGLAGIPRESLTLDVLTEEIRALVRAEKGNVR